MKFVPDSVVQKRIYVILGTFFMLMAAKPFVRGIKDATDSGSAYLTGASVGFASAGFLVLGGVLLGFAFAEKFSNPFTSWIDTIYNGGSTKEKPPLDFTRADKFEEQGLAEAAEREYERLLEYYPRSEVIWRRLILLQLATEGAVVARETAMEAKRRLRWNPAARHEIESMVCGR